MLRRFCCTATASAALPFSAQSAATPTQLHNTRSQSNKTTRVEDVAALVPDNATISVGGFVKTGAPEAVLEAIGQRFEQEGHPRNCTILFEGGPGPGPVDLRQDGYRGLGIDHLAKEGLVTRAIGSHYGQVPELGRMAQEGVIEAYNLPMGSIARMIRHAASKTPGHLTKVGFGTVVDPIAGNGGKLNSKTPDFVQVVELNGEKYLFFPAIPIDVGCIRATTADANGNLSMEREPLLADNFIIAQAAATNRGISIAQVERVAESHSIPLQRTFIPCAMVDAVVVSPPQKHWMSYATRYNPAATGEIRKQMSKRIVTSELDVRKVIARRAAMELAPDFRINLGIGMPEGVAKIAAEERLLDFVHFSTEAGVWGGIGTKGHDFGPAENADCVTQLHQQFDFYNGGGLDATCLGMGQIDQAGNNNVTRLGKALHGLGGFADISTGTRRVNFLGAFAVGAEMTFGNGKVVINKEGRAKKFVKKVDEVSFPGKEALHRKQIVRYITERCVFELCASKNDPDEPALMLLEIAPGLTLEKDILPMMDFVPEMPPNGVRTMDPSIFEEKVMNLRQKHFVPTMKDRCRFVPSTRTLFVNLSQLTVNNETIMDDIFSSSEECIKRSLSDDGNQKVNVIVNYNRFKVDPEFVEDYAKRVKQFNETYVLTNRRFSSRAFRSTQLKSVDLKQSMTVAEVREMLMQLQLLSPALEHHILQKEEYSAEEIEQLLDQLSHI